MLYLVQNDDLSKYMYQVPTLSVRISPLLYILFHIYVPVFPVKSITRKSFIDLQYIKRTSLKTFLDKNTDANSPDV